MISIFFLLTPDSFHLIKVETIGFVLLHLWLCLLGGYLRVLSVWRGLDILDLGSLFFNLLNLLLNRLLCLILRVILLHELAILGLIEIIGRIILHENGFISDVAGCIVWVQLGTLRVVVDVTLDPSLVFDIESWHVVRDPIVFEVCLVVSIVSVRYLCT